MEPLFRSLLTQTAQSARTVAREAARASGAVAPEQLDRLEKTVTQNVADGLNVVTKDVLGLSKMHTMGPKDVNSLESLDSKIKALDKVLRSSNTGIELRQQPGVGPAVRLVRKTSTGLAITDYESGASTVSASRSSSSSEQKSVGPNQHHGESRINRKRTSAMQTRAQARQFVERIVRLQSEEEIKHVKAYVKNLLAEESTLGAALASSFAASSTNSTTSFLSAFLTGPAAPSANPIMATWAHELEKNLYRDIVTLLFSLFREWAVSLDTVGNFTEQADPAGSSPPLLMGHDLRVDYHPIGTHSTTLKSRVPWTPENRKRVNLVVEQLLEQHPAFNMRRSFFGDGNLADEDLSHSHSSNNSNSSSGTSLFRGKNGEPGLLGAEFEKKYAQEVANASFRIAMDLFSSSARFEVKVLGHRVHWNVNPLSIDEIITGKNSAFLTHGPRARMWSPDRTSSNQGAQEAEADHETTTGHFSTNLHSELNVATEEGRPKHPATSNKNKTVQEPQHSTNSNQMSAVNHEAIRIFAEEFLRERRKLRRTQFLQLPEPIEREIYEYTLRLSLCILEEALLSSKIRMLGSRFRFSIVETIFDPGFSRRVEATSTGTTTVGNKTEAAGEVEPHQENKQHQAPKANTTSSSSDEDITATVAQLQSKRAELVEQIQAIDAVLAFDKER
ncbi:unnamed protein product [Amoebophrya sp. A120]|nr:unnamed protein product [Amoebophrya sp. A120]|eukprot:GSA120T00017665001.1